MNKSSFILRARKILFKYIYSFTALFLVIHPSLVQLRISIIQRCEIRPYDFGKKSHSVVNRRNLRQSFCTRFESVRKATQAQSKGRSWQVKVTRVSQAFQEASPVDLLISNAHSTPLSAPLMPPAGKSKDLILCVGSLGDLLTSGTRHRAPQGQRTWYLGKKRPHGQCLCGP